jgi:hypothetical protein
MPQPTYPPAITRSSGMGGASVMAVWVKSPVALRSRTASPANGVSPRAAIGRTKALTATTARTSGNRKPP